MSFLQEFMPAAVGFVGVACREKTGDAGPDEEGLSDTGDGMGVALRGRVGDGVCLPSRDIQQTQRTGVQPSAWTEAEFWQCWRSVAPGISCPEKGLPHVSPLPSLSEAPGRSPCSRGRGTSRGPCGQTRHSSLRPPAASGPKSVSYSSKSRHLCGHVELYEI